MKIKVVLFGLLISVLLAACGGVAQSTSNSLNTSLAGPPPIQTNGLGGLSSTFEKDCGKLNQAVTLSTTPKACQDLLAPYNLSVAPPYWIFSAAPKPPKVLNETGGRVSNAQAQLWAADLYRDQVLTQFAEKFGQKNFFQKIQIPNLWESPFGNVFSAGGTVSVPNCYLFPTTLKLFPVTTRAKAYFTSSVFALPTFASYSFVGQFTPPKGSACTIEEISPGGQLNQFSSLAKPVIAFMPGEVLADPLFGSLWYQDSAGSCADPIATTKPPVAWCR